MAIEITINQKVYHVGVAKGEEDKIINLAKNLNFKIENFKNQDPAFFMGLNNERLLLFLSLMLIEEDLESKKNLDSLFSENKKLEKLVLQEKQNLLKIKEEQNKQQESKVDNSALLHIEQLKNEINVLKNENVKLINELKQVNQNSATSSTANKINEDFLLSLEQVLNKKITKVKEHINSINASIDTIKNNL